MLFSYQINNLFIRRIQLDIAWATEKMVNAIHFENKVNIGVFH